MYASGIDVSSWQGYINWNSVAASDTSFAMIRSSFGTSGIDNQFYNNIQNAPNAGINCGAYHYCYATSVSAAQAEAQHFLNIISPYKFNYPVALDIEDSSLLSLGASGISAIATAFCQVIENAGYYVCIYSNLSWFLNYLTSASVSNYDKWLAQWSSSPSLNNIGMWQYTSTGSVNGISGDVDKNISYIDYPSIISSSGLNNSNGNSSNSGYIPPSTGGASDSTYTVQSGDTLSEIAQNFGISLQDLLSLNPQISDPDLIYPGQIINIPSGSGSSNNSNYYTVQSGDTLSEIAQNFGISLQDLLSLNPQISDPDLIYPGQIINIPSGSGSSNNSNYYTIQSGDTLSEIAQNFGVSLQDLLSLNPQISDPDLIYPGDIINIP